MMNGGKKMSSSEEQEARMEVHTESLRSLKWTVIRGGED